MTREEIIKRNIEVVEAHFHNENPDDVDKAVALYTDDIVWEAPARGVIYRNSEDVRRAYLRLFQSLKYHGAVTLRRFATEDYVVDDQIADVTATGDGITNLPFSVGTRMSVRVVHIFQMRDGKIAREIAYEMWRKKEGVCDHDDIPADAMIQQHSPTD